MTVAYNYMKRVFFLFLVIFLLCMCVKDMNEHAALKQKDCQKQQNIVFLKTHKEKRNFTKC